MDIGPLLPGRMPNSLVVQRLQAQMQDSQVSMGLLEQQSRPRGVLLGTGR